jgi:protein-tyrosine phosphatase
MPTRILFVCLGNICRSPLAEGILKHLAASSPGVIEIDSAGTANYHSGEAPDHRTRKNAISHGVNLNDLRARQFQVSDFDNFELILVMDKNNYQDVLKLAKSESHRAKVHLFLAFCQHSSVHEMPDPYYGNEKDFEEVFQLTYGACEKLWNDCLKQQPLSL